MTRPNLLLRLVMAFTLCGCLKVQAQTSPMTITTLANAQNKAPSAAVAAGKRATALVDTPDSNGSAFCIHESGIFATNAHVVEGFSKVKVVVYPGETTQRVLTARVGHYDEDNDLAVLITDPPLETQAPGIPPLTVLPLGDSNDLFETMPIAVFGFPFGTDLALGEREMPGVTVTTGRITALRKLQGQLKEVQLDAATNPGNSGGPVLNEQGQVVGIMYAAVGGAQGLNFAIPTNTLRGLLSVPEIRFDPPPVAWAARLDSQEWSIEIAPLTQFTPATGTATNYDLNVAVKQNGVWRALTVSKVSPEGAAVTEFRATGRVIKLDDPTFLSISYKLTLLQNGRIVAVREGPVRVTDIGSINPNRNRRPNFPIPGRELGKPRPNGPTVQYPANGHWYQCVSMDRNTSFDEARMAAEAMNYGGVRGHLATVTSAGEGQFILNRVITNLQLRQEKAWLGGFQKPDSAEPDTEWSWVTGEPWRYSNWAAGEPNDVGNEDSLQMIPDGSWNDARDTDFCNSFVVEFEAPPGTNIPAQAVDVPQVEGDKTIINLPAPVAAATVGGGGRFLLFYLKAEQKVAVFDAEQKKIVRYIPAPGDNVLLTAGQKKLVLLLTDQNILQRWDLQTGQREQSAPLPDDQAVTSIAMGAASDGPLLIARGKGLAFLDLATLQRVEMLDEGTGKPDNLAVGASAAPDGSAFAIFNEAGMRQLWIISREDNRLSKHLVAGSHSGVMPSFDGRWWFTSKGIFTTEGKPVVADQLLNGRPGGPYQTMVPSYDPSYFVALKSRNQRDNGGFGFDNGNRGPFEATIYSSNDRRPLVSLGVLEEITDNGAVPRFGSANRSPGLSLEKRLYYLPDRKLLVTVGSGMAQLVLRPIDLKKEMSRDGQKYFFVASTPPRKATKGSLLAYQLDVQSQSGGMKYSVESGPAGLTITPTGLVEWEVPANFADGEATVLISIRDNSGQELYHTFKVQVR